MPLAALVFSEKFERQQPGAAIATAAALPQLPMQPQPPSAAASLTPLPTSIAAPWLLSFEVSSMAPGVAAQQAPVGQQHARATMPSQPEEEAHGSQLSLKLGGSTADMGGPGVAHSAGGGSARSRLAGQVSGGPARAVSLRLLSMDPCKAWRGGRLAGRVPPPLLNIHPPCHPPASTHALLLPTRSFQVPQGSPTFCTGPLPGRRCLGRAQSSEAS